MRHRGAVSIIGADAPAFGMQLPVAAQSRYFAQPWESAAGAGEIARIACACDTHGYFSLAVSDHVCIHRDAAASMSTTWYHAVATLGYLAGITSRIHLLSYVWVAPYRHPLETAKAFSTLDALSNGRVILGVGTGHHHQEFDVLGIPFRERGRRLDEAIDLIREAFRAEYPEHSGALWQTRDMGLRPRPARAGGPPIWVGGSSRAALRRAAMRGDGWLPQGEPEMGMAVAIAFLHEERRRQRGDEPIEIAMNAPWMYVGRPSFDVPAATRTGSPDELAEALRATRDLGIHLIGVRFRSRSCEELLDQIEAFATSVVPLVRQR